MALASHPPFFTSQLSVICQKNVHPYDHSHDLHFNSALLPVQMTLETEPVFVYPVLQVHLAAFVFASCEHMALASQPPLFTWQVSTETNHNQFIEIFI